MTRVDIEYCVPCGYLDRAEQIQHQLLEEFGQELDSVALVTGDHGVLRVTAADEVVFDKNEGDEYDVDAITEGVRTHLGEA